MEPTVHPELKQPLTKLCSDPKTTVVVLSGSGRTVLDEVITGTLVPSLWTTRSNFNSLLLQNFKEFDVWLAAENGMFLNPLKGEWMTTIPELLQNMEWVGSVKVHILSFNSSLISPLLWDIDIQWQSCVFSMFLSTSQNEHLGHILKKGKLHLYGITDTQVLQLCLGRHFCILHAVFPFTDPLTIIIDVEFGRLQAKDMLQHLSTGSISNASLEVFQGSRSIEVRAAGVTKVTSWF